MNSILAVEKGLPPGLWLPTADEPTDQYRAENYAYKNRPYEDIVEYGTFVVALAFFNQPRTNRVSLMPTTVDIEDMHAEGFGVSMRMLNTGRVGGLDRLQHSLGFYPRNYVPLAADLMKRFHWIVNYAYHLDPTEGEITSTSQLVRWGAQRDLSPARDIVLSVLGGTQAPLREILNLTELTYKQRFTFSDVYRFGARVIAENNGPIEYSDLEKRYAGELGDKPQHVITNPSST